MSKSIFDCAIFSSSEFGYLVQSGILRMARPGVILRCPIDNHPVNESVEYYTGSGMALAQRERASEWADIPSETDTARLLE